MAPGPAPHDGDMLADFVAQSDRLADSGSDDLGDSVAQSDRLADSMVQYDVLADEVAAHGMEVRGGFQCDGDDAATGPQRLDGAPVRCVVIVGNVGDAMWRHFEAGRTSGPDPLDTWTRSVLAPIAHRYGAEYRHPSDEPYIPMQRWAQRADAVFASPIGVLIDPIHGLWHAYRGAFLFDRPVTGLPGRPQLTSPCLACPDRPCLTACPVDAFDGDAYNDAACRHHVTTADSAQCYVSGCAARLACPVGETRYCSPQVGFHMEHFVGPVDTGTLPT